MAVRIGELLLKEKLITPEQLQSALTQQKANGGKLGYNLVKMGFVKDEQITALLSKQYGVPSINLAQFKIDPTIVKLVPTETARKYQIIPLSRSGSTLTIAMTDPTNVFAMDDIKFMTGYNVEPVVASETAVIEAIQRYYPAAAKAAAAAAAGGGQSALELATKGLEELQALEGGEDVEVLEELEEISAEALAKQGEEAPVVRLVNVVLMSAIQKGASDIHIEPYERTLRVRFRIDGTLYEMMSPPFRMKAAIISRLKIMADLDIAERRVPQDGRIKLRLLGRSIDLRVSSLPTIYGEKVVMRILDKGNLNIDLNKLGFQESALKEFTHAIAQPYGMVLVTGPTGSGKTTTLYSALSKINQPEVNIMTSEDPVEYNLEGINQVLVNESVGLTFSAALRAFLRQDPNIIMVGEIRDIETGSIAVKAALTGHLVLSTLHTNDAPSTINRMIDMGIEPFLVASSTNLIMAQRLLRKVCASCKSDVKLHAEVLRELGISEDEARKVAFKEGKGCVDCNNTGYKGRLGVYEVMPVSPKIRDMILDRSATSAIKKTAVTEGMLTLRMDGLLKLKNGITTAEEVLKETAADR